MQSTLLCLCIWEILLQNISAMAILQENAWILLARLVAAMVLHLMLVKNVQAGLERMKFAVNHPYMFKENF